MTFPSPRPGMPVVPLPSTAAQDWIDIEAAITDIDRLREIAQVDLDDERLRARLQEVTAQTCRELDLPISLVTLVLDSSQLIAASTGVAGWIAAAGGTPVEWSFCANAVASGRAYVVPDAVSDPGQCDNPLVTLDGIASYAGVPLVSDSGRIWGAHCVIGTRPRTFTGTDLAVLERGAAQTMAILRTHALMRASQQPPG
jgi:GAF domain-containing protein